MSPEGGQQIAYYPIESVTKRDVYWVWDYFIEKEAELKQMGLLELTIGPHNFARLLEKCLLNKAFKCLLVLLKIYKKSILNTTNPESQTVNLVHICAQSMTVYAASAKIIVNLFEYAEQASALTP